MAFAAENLIAWGDCDTAGIVYFPRYFRFIDDAFHDMLRKSGFSHRRLIEEFGVHVPIIDAGAKFISPATFDDRLVVGADVVHWGTKSFRVNYNGSREGVPVFEAYEARVWARVAADGTMVTVAITPEFKAAVAAARG